VYMNNFIRLIKLYLEFKAKDQIQLKFNAKTQIYLKLRAKDQFFYIKSNSSLFRNGFTSLNDAFLMASLPWFTKLSAANRSSLSK